MGMKCIISGSESGERAHVISKGKECREFKIVYNMIYPNLEYFSGIEDSQNIVFLREDFHRGPMDNLCKTKDMKIRRLGFDFLNKACYIESDETGNIERYDWKQAPDVKKEYFAWSNSECTRRLVKYMRRIDRRLTDYKYWVENY